jgi:diguanylate cyclase (GGDEF)-like protein
MTLLRDLRWLYLVAFAPLATDWLENGHGPATPRESITEIVLGAAIAAVVMLVCRQHARIRALADRDPATGLLNARRFREDLAREVARSRRQDLPLCLAFLDLDRFKSVNDRFGHACGDAVLAAFAQELGKGIRWGIDQCYRVGGDEFAVLLPGVQKEQAGEIVDRIREQSDATQGILGQVGAGVSAGVVELGSDETPEALVKRADARMYALKGVIGSNTIEIERMEQWCS